jgi:hypothetical protein
MMGVQRRIQWFGYLGGDVKSHVAFATPACTAGQASAARSRKLLIAISLVTGGERQISMWNKYAVASVLTKASEARNYAATAIGEIKVRVAQLQQG